MATTARPIEKIETTPAVSGLTLADVLLLLCVTIWAFNIPLIKLTLGYISPLALSVIRFGLTGIITFGIVWFKERSLAIQWRHLLPIILCALTGITLNQVFFVYALKNTTSSEVSLLMAATPSFAVLAAYLAKQEKASAGYWKSLPISLAGIGLIVLTAPNAQLGGGWLGDVLALCTAASWATYTVLIRPLMRHYSIAKLSAYITMIGTIMLLPFGGPQFDFGAMANIPPGIWLAISYSTLVAVVLTIFLWYFGVKKLGGPRTAVYAYIQPFLGVVAATLILSETIIGWQVVGGGLVILGLIIYRRRPRAETVAKAD